MENTIKLSIIIPVFNSERYLEVCIQSVLAQTFKNYELILVDDASTDSSGAICDDTAARDPRVKVIHHADNKGLSISREDGINIAHGEYVSFVDNDDYICPNMYETLFLYTAKADMVCCQGADVSNDEIKEHRLHSDRSDSLPVQIVTGKEYCESIYSPAHAFGLAGPLWGKIMKRDYFISCLHEIQQYKQDFYWVYMEDVLFAPIFYYQVPKVCYCPQLMYLHRKGGLSYSLAPSTYFYQGCYAQEILLNYFQGKWSKRTYDHFLLNTFLLFISNWYRSWKYEKNGDTKGTFDQYMTRMYHTYQTALHDMKTESLSDLIKKEMVLFFNKNRILWCSTIGNVYFSRRTA